NYVKKYTDLPFLVMLREHGDEYRTDRFLRASDLNDSHKLGEWKTVVWDELTNQIQIPNGTQGHRWDNDNKWNLELKKEDGSTIDPRLSFMDSADEITQVSFPYFAEEEGGTVERGVPVRYITD